MILLSIAFIVMTGLFSYQLLHSARQQAELKKQLALSEQNAQTAAEKQRELTAALAELKGNFDNTVQCDVVTGFPTRQVFEDKLLQTLNQSRRHQLIFSVLSLDLDEFKAINNALGHDVGDALLKEVGVRLRSCLRQIDVVSRFSGDEFVFILPQLAKTETVAYLAQRFLDVISEPFHILQHELFITASIGISLYPHDGDEAKMLLKNANIALQQARARGCNSYQFYREEMHTLSRRELTLNSSLRSEAIYNEFTVYYQPLLDVKNKNIVCMEALLRWQHSTLGLITPREFIRLAESSGRIVAIGEWMLRHACQQFKQWQSQGFFPAHIAVNVSMRQLENPHFSHKISQILQETQVDPTVLVLDVMQSVLFPQVELVEKTLHMLKRLGIKIAIDDFGKGYLSLQHLRRFPIDYLKIDYSLIQDIATNKESVAIVKMVIALARSLQLTVIAEGVETHEQKEALLALGCSVMQGYYFCHPQLPELFTSVMLQDISANA